MDVANAIDAGHAGSPDHAQLEHATAEGRVLFTYNVGDFFALHVRFREEGRSHAGLILAVQQRYSVGEQDATNPSNHPRALIHEMKDSVEFLSSWSASGAIR